MSEKSHNLPEAMVGEDQDEYLARAIELDGTDPMDLPTAVGYLTARGVPRMSRRYLYRLVNERRIVFAKVAGRLWFHRDDLDAYAEQVLRRHPVQR